MTYLLLYLKANTAMALNVYLCLFVLFFALNRTRANVIFQINFKNCTCVPYFQCSDETGDVITDGTGLLESRKYTSGACSGYFDVCCDAPKISTTEAPLELKGCGYQKPEIFPWSGALFYQQTLLNPPSYRCGVSLIHKQVVLTTAHCIENGILTVHIGNANKSVKKAIIHPQYNFNTLQNDVALLILSSPISLQKNTELICIPPPGTVLDNSECIVTTWNKDIFMEKLNSQLLMVKVPIVPRNKCVKMLRSTRLGYYFQLHRSFICAGGEGNKDTCGGDGGSPLVCPILGQPNRYHQAGIVSWGIGCGENKTPVVYVNLPIFRDWIDNEMLRHGFEINSYRY